jgi:hypothetical protein
MPVIPVLMRLGQENHKFFKTIEKEFHGALTASASLYFCTLAFPSSKYALP